MRTKISVPDDVDSEATKEIPARVAQLARERLAQEMEAGYCAEAEALSLDVDWSAVETEGL